MPVFVDEIGLNQSSISRAAGRGENILMTKKIELFEA